MRMKRMINSHADPPIYEEIELVVGNLSHNKIKSRDTDLPIGCSESESKSGISSGCPMRKGRPEASCAVANKQQRVIHIPGPVGRVIPCQGLASGFRGTTVHTTRSSPLINYVRCLLANLFLIRG